MSYPIVPLGDVAEIRSGSINPQKHPYTLFELYSIPGFDNDKTPERLPGSEIKSNKTCLPHKGILFSKLNPRINRVWTINELTNAIRISSTEFVCLVPDEKRLDLDFLSWRLREPNIAKQLPVATAAATKSRERIQPKSLLRLPIPLPPLDEQRRIVGILNRAAKIERLLARARELMREFIPALFIKMFGDPADNPMGWEVRSLGEVCAVNPRAMRTRSSDDMLVSFVPMAAVDERLGAITVRQERPLSEVSKGFTSFKDGDVLFAKITPCMENGKAALAGNLINGIGRGSTEFYVLRPDGRVLGEYLCHFVRRARFREEAKRHFTGTAGQQRVPRSFMENSLILLPPLEKQQQFTKIVESAHAASRLEVSGSRVADKLTASLMSRLLRDDA